jgi:Cu2+-exporting ATPase
MNIVTPLDPALALDETVLSVPGMRCAGCISKIERGLTEVEGIATARVNFTAKRVAIHHLPTLSLPDIQSALSRIGFDSQPLSVELTRQDQDSAQLLRAMAVAGFAAMNIMLLSVAVWSGAGGATREMFHWISALIAIPTVFYAGQPFFRSALKALKHGRTNMDVPISIGVTLTTLMSLYETATNGHHAWFDGAVMLLFFLLTGRWLDSVMRDRARDGVTALLQHRSAGAWTLDTDGRAIWTDAAELQPGMVMLVAVGERLAADGTLAKGETRLDLSLITGESAPETHRPGDPVLAGTLNLDAPIEVTVTAVGKDTTIADIARMMEDAGQGKSRYVRLADRAARYYAPAVHSLAAGSAIGWLVAGAGVHQALLIAVAVLLITCPCALGLAVPVAQIVAAGALMKRGILLKDGSALERLAEVDGVLFDKTGTLTLGRPVPVNLDDMPPDVLAVMLALARTSRHVLSLSLARAIDARGIAAAVIEDVQEEAGQGVSATWQGRRVHLGRPAHGVEGSELATAFRVEDEPGQVVQFTDALRPEAVETIGRLAAMGLDSSILSGDRIAAVAPVARTLGLTAMAGLRPQEKLDAIQRLSGAGKKMLMVGDGINDGPALAAGHASIAPASASDVGQQAADLVFVGDSLAPIATAIRAARKTMRIVRENLGLAIAYNVIAVPLAIAGQVTPLIAALAMSGSSLLVIGNALRLNRIGR